MPIPFLAAGLGGRLLAGAPGFIGAWWKAGVGVAIGAALALPVGQCQGRGQERQAAKARAAAAAELQQTKNAAAAQAAAAERETDQAAVTVQQKARNDAIDAAPGGRAPPSSLALGCQRLRQQGVAEPALPAHCRPGGPR
jgi:hypothetical protein